MNVFLSRIRGYLGHSVLVCLLCAVSSPLLAAATSITQTAYNSGYSLPVGKAIGQSFTADEGMLMTGVGLSTNGAMLTLSIYEGEGNSGTLRYRENSVTFMNRDPGVTYTHNLTGPLRLNAGSVYTVVISNAGGEGPFGTTRLIHGFVHGLADPPRDPYTGGKRILFNPGPEVPDPAADLVFRIEGTTELELSGNDLLIQSGDTTPREEDGTDFGALVNRNETETRTFELTNTSNRTLTLGTVTISDDTNFRVTRQPASSLARGASTTFDIIFDPVNLSPEPVQTIAIPSNGIPDPYQFQVKGVALMDTIPPEPEITGPGGIQTGEFEVTVDFGEPVYLFTRSDLSVSNGSVVSMVGNSSGEYEVRIQPEAEGEVTVFLPADRAKDLATNDNLASNTYSVDYIPPFTVEDDDGEPYETPIVPRGGSFQFSVQGGSGDLSSFNNRLVYNEYGSVGIIEGLGDGRYEFRPIALKVFAGTYQVAFTDNESGYTRTLEFIVPLEVELSRSTLLESGPRSESEVRVLGAEKGSALSLSIESTSADGVPVLTETEITAPDDYPNGNVATSTLKAVSLPADAVEFDITVSAFDYDGNTVSGQVVPTIEYSGSLTDYLDEPLAGVEVSVVTGDEAATVQRDELDEAYVAETTTEGEFTLAVPESLTETPLALQFAGEGLALISRSADDCLTPTGGCELELTYDDAAEAPVFDQPAGRYQDQVMIELTSATEGAGISYTLDGSDPTPTQGQQMESGDVLILRETASLKAMAFVQGLAPSAVTEAEFDIDITVPDESEGSEGSEGSDSSGGSSSGGSLGFVTIFSLLALLLMARLTTALHRKYWINE